MTKHTILFLAANPNGTDPRALDREARSIGAELKRSGYRERFELVTRWAVEPLDLLRELRELKPTVVHVSGHGGEHGLLFQAADGGAQIVAPAAIAETLGAAGTSVKLVVLSGCYSEPAADTLLAHVDCVVGTGGSIHDDVARSFAIGFYGALGEQESVAAACRHGSAAISLAGLPDAERPQLKVRDGFDATQLVMVADAPAKPIPSYPDAAVKALSERLEDARARARKLREAGIPTDDLDREILDLRRQLREGGQLRAGDSLGDGRYLLVRPVGRGGFAVVWEAYDHLTSQSVAIKVLHASLASDQLRHARFFRGARAMMKLTHPAVARVLEPEAEDGGFYYFVMELVPGGNLRGAVLEGRLEKAVILPLILRVSEAIAEAHMQGMVHRDIKPSNILLDGEGNPKLTDFDLVGAPDTTGGTRSGALGTFLYAAPECLDRPQEATTRVDVYGLGMTAIFCLSGRELTLSTVKNPVLAIDQLSCSDQFRAVLLRAVAWDPDERFADAAAMGSALRDAVNAHPLDSQIENTIMEPKEGHAADDRVAREAAAHQAAAYAAVAENRRKAAAANRPAGGGIAREAAAHQAAAYAAVGERARKRAAQRAARKAGARRAAQNTLEEAKLDGARDTDETQAVAASGGDAGHSRPGPLTTSEALQMGILKRQAVPRHFIVGAISFSLMGLGIYALAKGWKANGSPGWKAWVLFVLWIGISGWVGAVRLYLYFWIKACVRCDRVLRPYSLRHNSLSAVKSAASAGDAEELANVAELAEWRQTADAHLWLCDGCQEIGIIEIGLEETVLRGGGLKRLAQKPQAP